MTLVEIMIAMTVLSMVLGLMLASINREAQHFGEMTGVNTRERSTSEMIARLESLLEYGIGSTPAAFLSADLAAGNAGGVASVDTTLGFPLRGVLLLEPGTAFEERIEYDGLDPVAGEFQGLAPGAQCTPEFGHFNGTPVRWAGMAVAIADQVAPTVDQYDGQVASDSGPIFFRGDGTGFSFRVPTDPTGTGNFFDANGAVTWGSTVRGVETLDGWAAVTFEPVDQLLEATGGRDLNGDGDAVDVFDMGRIDYVTWNSATGVGPPSRVGLCPPIVLQERCNWGGDLDGDGLDDPILVWIPDEGRLEVRMFLGLGSINEIEVVRSLNSTIHLRNGALE